MSKKENVVNLGLLKRPKLGMDVSSPAVPVSEYLTLKNIVIALGLATFLIFLGSVVSARIAFLFAALLGLAGLVVYEMLTRRVWENALVEQMEKMNRDYERIVRELARSRNDMTVLKKGLASAGAVARNYGVTASDSSPEQRMLKAIADQLSLLGKTPDAVSDSDKKPVSEEPPLAADKFTAFKGDEDALGRSLSDKEVLSLVQAAVDQDRIDLFRQPIVALPQRKARFYEVFSKIRIQQGVYLPARRYIEVAMQQEDLIPTIDNLLLLRCLQVIRDEEEGNTNRAFFCNITSLTLDDPKFMADLVEFIAQNRSLAGQLVFELAQDDLATMSPDAVPVLNGLARLGCRFSMDRVRSLSFDFAFLEARHVRFIKVETKLILQELQNTGGFQYIKRLKAEMDTSGIDIIVEKVETDKELLELLDLEIDYGQGYLFGKPELAV